MSSVAYSVTWVLFLFSFALVPLSFLAGVAPEPLRPGIGRHACSLSLDDGIPLRDALAAGAARPLARDRLLARRRDGWVDDRGREVDEPRPAGDRSVTTIERDGRPIAALVHDPALADEPELDRARSRRQRACRSRTCGSRPTSARSSEFLVTVVNTAPSLLVHDRSRGPDREPEPGHGRRRVASSDEEQIRGRHFWDVFVDEGDREALQERFRDAAPDFAPSQYENTFTDARGERRVIEWRSAPVTDASGRVSSIVAGGIDITERKQREVQLQRERDITDTLMQAIPSIVVVVDRKGIIVDSGVDETRAGVNNAFRNVLGWPDHALVRQSVLDFIDPDDGHVALEAIASAANGVASPSRSRAGSAPTEKGSWWRGPRRRSTTSRVAPHRSSSSPAST